ncbi:MAG: hypothetical protein INR71_02375 [Terriglobus roseus]|nr:hypothetical protein [Terriglobus roseus]
MGIPGVLGLDLGLGMGRPLWFFHWGTDKISGLLLAFSLLSRLGNLHIELRGFAHGTSQ